MNPILHLNTALTLCLLRDIGINSLPFEFSGYLLEIMTSEAQDPWKRTVCAMQWALHYTLQKKLQTLLDNSYMQSTFEKKDIRFLGNIYGDGFAPIIYRRKSTQFYIKLLKTDINESWLYITINTKLDIESVEELLRLAEFLTIDDIGGVEMTKNEPTHTWVHPKNKELWNFYTIRNSVSRLSAHLNKNGMNSVNFPLPKCPELSFSSNDDFPAK